MCGVVNFQVALMFFNSSWLNGELEENCFALNFFLSKSPAIFSLNIIISSIDIIEIQSELERCVCEREQKKERDCILVHSYATTFGLQ